MSFKIVSPRFINDKKEMVAKVVFDNGRKQTISFTVPEDINQSGNKYWDYIRSNFEITELEASWDQALEQHRKAQEHRKEKEKQRPEIERLTKLFELKTEVFQIPFIQNADIETKSAIRRAPNQFLLQLIVNDVIKNHMEENKLSFHDIMDVLDEHYYNESIN